jgi:hypothetical protein
VMTPRMKIVDVRTGLSEEELSALEEKVTAWTGVKRIADENGSRVQIAPAEGPVAEITAEGELRPVEPNVLRIGTPESYVHEIITANITIPSRPEDKAGIRRVSEEEAKNVDLPAVIRYKRKSGKRREEVGFDLDSAPDLVKVEGGIDLKALVALLVLRVRALEREVEMLRDAVGGRGRGGSAP